MVNISYAIDKSIPVPLYYQIAQLIRHQIESGELQPGDQIPTESEFQERFNVSRATVRQAVSGLVYEGLLERRRAKGTIVSRSKLQETLYGFASFTNQILKQSLALETRILSFGLIPATATLAEYLQVEYGERLAAMERLRFVAGDPVCVEKWYAPAGYLPGIDRSFFKEKGLEQSTYYVLQERFGIHLFKAIDTVSAVVLEAREAQLLNMEKGMPALLRTRISYTAGDTPMVYASGFHIIKLIFTLTDSRRYESGSASPFDESNSKN